MIGIAGSLDESNDPVTVARPSIAFCADEAAKKDSTKRIQPFIDWPLSVTGRLAKAIAGNSRSSDAITAFAPAQLSYP